MNISQLDPFTQTSNIKQKQTSVTPTTRRHIRKEIESRHYTRDTGGVVSMESQAVRRELHCRQRRGRVVRGSGPVRSVGPLSNQPDRLPNQDRQCRSLQHLKNVSLAQGEARLAPGESEYRGEAGLATCESGLARTTNPRRVQNSGEVWGVSFFATSEGQNGPEGWQGPTKFRPSGKAGDGHEFKSTT